MGQDHGDMTGSSIHEEISLLVFGYPAEFVSKMNPDGADLSAGERKRRKRQAQIGLTSNIVGIGAGVTGTAAAMRDDRFAEGGKVARGLHRMGQKIPKPISSKTGKAGAALAGGALALQVGNNVGDLVANRVLAREAKKKVRKRGKKGTLTAVGLVGTGAAVGTATGYENGKNKRKRIKKNAFCTYETYTSTPQTRRGKLIRVAGNRVEPKVKDQMKKVQQQIKKTDMVEVSKLDEDKKQVFGWASVVEKNGEAVVDLQGDYIPVDEMEKSAYEFVRKSRAAGDMHRRNGDSPFVVGEMIESFALTPEKKQAMGLPDDMPSAWWVGFQIHDDDVWSEIKAGKRKGFSVHGVGRREPI